MKMFCIIVAIPVLCAFIVILVALFSGAESERRLKNQMQKH